MSKSRLATLTSGRFFWLLIAIVAGNMLATFTPPGGVGKWESSVPLCGILIACTYAARGGRTRLLVTLLLNCLFFAAGTVYVLYHSHLAQYLCFVMLLICLLFSLVTTLSFVLTTGTIGPDHIYGAICAYVLIAMCFAAVYTVQAMAIPGAFNGIQTLGPDDRPFEDMLYFSFTTLSTVGYGDITPVHRSARAVCSLEMLTGTFYVAILIARLAGLYPPRTPDD